MRSTLVFNIYDIVWWCLCHLELTQSYCAMALRVFIIQTVNVQISVLIVPDEIYPCFQHIWHCLMILMSPRVDPAILCHGPPSFHYPDCKCSNQCFDWELTARTQKTSRTKSGPHGQLICHINEQKSWDKCWAKCSTHKACNYKKMSFVNAPLYYVVSSTVVQKRPPIFIHYKNPPLNENLPLTSP